MTDKTTWSVEDLTEGEKFGLSALQPDAGFQNVLQDVAVKGAVDEIVNRYDKKTIIAAFRSIVPDLTAQEMYVHQLKVTPTTHQNFGLATSPLFNVSLKV